MTTDHRDRASGDTTGKTVARSKWITIGFLLVIAYFLWTEHRAHVVQVLPFLLLAACPLMHLFMHHGHGAGHRHADRGGNDVKSVDGDPR